MGCVHITLNNKHIILPRQKLNKWHGKPNKKKTTKNQKKRWQNFFDLNSSEKSNYHSQTDRAKVFTIICVHIYL